MTQVYALRLGSTEGIKHVGTAQILDKHSPYHYLTQIPIAHESS